MASGLQTVRAAVVSPYWSFWESSVEQVDLRRNRGEILDAVVDDLRTVEITVTSAHLLEPDGVPPSLEADTDVLIVPVTMAAPPTTLTRALDRYPQDLPVIVWALLLPDEGDGSAEGIVRNGATVGTPLTTSALHRQGRSFHVVAGARSPATAERVAVTARGVTLARSLEGLRIARIGDHLPGYVSVDASDEDLHAAFGLETVDIAPDILRQRALAVDQPTQATLHDELPATAEDPDAMDLPMSLALRHALRGICEQHHVAAGAINCHGPALRHAPDIGITPCYALGMETTAGRPFTCTGDVLTAIAMLLAKRLAGASLYHEIESIDPSTGICILANSGEFDLGWPHSPSTARVRPNPWFQRDATTGASVSHDLTVGPATLIAVVRQPPGRPSRFRVVAATGRILDDRPSDLPTAGGSFRFEATDPVRAWEDWVRAGVSHHSALAPGDLTEGLRVLARERDIEFVHIR